MSDIQKNNGNKKMPKKQKELLLFTVALFVCTALLIAVIMGGESIDNDNSPDNGTDDVPVVYINEISSSGQSSLYDEDGDYPDFIELYNPNDEDIDISGWFITDKDNDHIRYRFPQGTVIEADGILLLFADGKDTQGAFLHLNFSLSEDETVYLYTDRLVLADSVQIPVMADGISYGRDMTDPESWVFFSTPTPAQKNISTSYTTNKEAAGHKGGPLFISEVLPASTLSAYSGEDFIEIYNMSDERISLDGWYLSDSRGDMKKWAFPVDAVISPGEYLVIVADGTGEGLHCSFRLSRYSESVYLSMGDILIDKLSWGVGRCNISIGILSGEDTQRRYFKTPTPGKANTSDYYTQVSPEVFYSVRSGLYSEGFSVEMFTYEEGAQIRYTTNGTLPTSSSALYTGPISVSSNTTIRAASFMDGRLPSEYSAANYVITKNEQSLPVVFIATSSSDLSSIYTDDQHWQRPRINAHIMLIEPDGTVGFSEECSIAKHGNVSARYRKKSLTVYFRETTGRSGIDYDLFPDDDSAVTHFSSFILRTGGQDWWGTTLKDAFIQTLASQSMGIDYQRCRPCVVYINGRYWGLYYIREQQSTSYLESYYGIDPDNVDIIGFNERSVHEGSIDEYNRLVAFVKNNNMANDEVWGQLCDMVDIDSFIDCYLTHMYWGDYDTVNIKWWKENTEGAKWRWLTCDLDLSLGLPMSNNLARLTNPNGHGVGNAFSSVLMYNFMKNESFRQTFLDHVQSYWTTVFDPNYALNYLNEFYAQIKDEIPRDFSRWGLSMSTHRSEMDTVYKYISQRPAAFRGYMKSYFGLSDEELDRRFPLTEVTVEKTW